MESPFPLLSLNPLHPPKPQNPSTSLKVKPLVLLSKTPKTPQKNPFLCFLKPPLVALTATALFLSHRFPKPSLASLPPPQTQTQTLTLTDAEKAENLEQSLESNPHDIRSLRALMELRIKSNQLPEAISLIDRLLPLEPDNADLPLLRSHLLASSGDVDSARAGFEDALARNPLSVEAYHGLVMVEKDASDGESENLDGIMRRIESAMEQCKKEKRKEDLRDFKLLKAQILVVQGRYEESLRVYEELVREEPRDFRPYLCEGIVYSVLRRKDDAERMYEKYRRLVPKGHPYSGYFDDNVIAMKVFSQLEENRSGGGGVKIGGR